MLVQSTALVPTLISALFLDHEHPRKDMDKTLRAGIQCDGAQCFLQLALFDLGKQLLVQHPESLDALRALTHGAALTEEAGLAASAALAAVEGPLSGPGRWFEVLRQPLLGSLLLSLLLCFNRRFKFEVCLLTIPVSERERVSSGAVFRRYQQATIEHTH